MSAHRTQGTNRCEECGKTFSSQRELREHEEVCDARQEGTGANYAMERKRGL